MQPLIHTQASTFKNVRFVLTDMDETLTYKGRLSASTYDALERLQLAGLTVIPVTAAPAGWCDQMARMWPVDGVIGENGGLFFRREAQGHGVTRAFWHPDEARPGVADRLARIGEKVKDTTPFAKYAEDQSFRLTSLAFSQQEDPGRSSAIIAALLDAGADVTINNLWILAWLGGYDKLKMTRRVLAETYGLDIDLERDRDAVLYVGDSTNDAPMFEFFRHTVGVSTVTKYLAEIPTPPAWIANGPGGAGFVEAANAVMRSRRS